MIVTIEKRDKIESKEKNKIETRVSKTLVWYPLQIGARVGLTRHPTTAPVQW